MSIHDRCHVCGAKPGKPCRGIYGQVLKLIHPTRNMMPTYRRAA